MSVRMAGPWRNPSTGMLDLRQRTPSDLVPAMKGRTVDLPIGPKTVPVTISDLVQVSLGTKDAREAKARHAQADARLRTFWARARELARIREHGVDPKLAADVAGMLVPKPYVSPDMMTAVRLSVWTGLAAHRPLGNINRARNAPYQRSAAFRERFNGCLIHEPGSAR